MEAGAGSGHGQDVPPNSMDQHNQQWSMGWKKATFFIHLIKQMMQLDSLLLMMDSVSSSGMYQPEQENPQCTDLSLAPIPARAGSIPIKCQNDTARKGKSPDDTGLTL